MLKQEVGWSNFLELIFEAWETCQQIQLGEIAASDLGCLRAKSYFSLKIKQQQSCFSANLRCIHTYSILQEKKHCQRLRRSRYCLLQLNHQFFQKRTGVLKIVSWCHATSIQLAQTNNKRLKASIKEPFWPQISRRKKQRDVITSFLYLCVKKIKQHNNGLKSFSGLWENLKFS